MTYLHRLLRPAKRAALRTESRLHARLVRAVAGWFRSLAERSRQDQRDEWAEELGIMYESRDYAIYRIKKLTELIAADEESK